MESPHQSRRVLEWDADEPAVTPDLTLDDDTRRRTVRFLCADEVTRCGASCRAWYAAASDPDLWHGLTQHHLTGGPALALASPPSSTPWPFALAARHAGRGSLTAVTGEDSHDRASFVRQIASFRTLLRTEDQAEPTIHIEPLVRLAECSAPCPPLREDGATLLVKRATHLRLMAIVRMDDNTEWVSRLPQAMQNAFYVDTLVLLELLCERNSSARTAMRALALTSNGYMTLGESLDHCLLRYLSLLSPLEPRFFRTPDEQVVLGHFGSLDCRGMDLQESRLRALRAIGSMIYHLFAADKDSHGEELSFAARLLEELDVASSSSREVLRRAALAEELSGTWNTAMCLAHDRRNGSVLGDIALELDAMGSLHGRGRDAHGEFTVSGFWDGRLWCLRRTCPDRVYGMDVVAFLAQDATLRGVWHKSPDMGGFWGWRGRPRDRRIVEPDIAH